MKTLTRFRNLALTAALSLAAATTLFAQYTTIDQARDYINDRLSHSVIAKIDADGTVSVSSPGSKYKFNLRDVSFNYNGGNDDDRVRVFCDNCIEQWEKKQMTEKLSRQSFACENRTDADEVIAAFRFIKKTWQGESKSAAPADKKLKIQDITLGLNTVNDAINFINDNLSFTMVAGIDEKGTMTLNAPSDIYVVDLARAEFGLNELGSEPQVRIYGDFSISEKRKDGKSDNISRNSFQAQSTAKARKVVTVLYYLKSTYSALDPASIHGLRNVSGAKTDSYKTAAEAINYINDRLAYSIILGLDKNGILTINAPDEIYRFGIREAKVTATDRKENRSDWFGLPLPGSSSAAGMLVECNGCLKSFTEPGESKSVDEQLFQCRSLGDAREVITAMDFLKGKL